MKEIALVLCCFNKKEDAINAIESIFKSTIQNFDLIVVDNASTDGTAEFLAEKYGEKIILIVNEVNSGAGGGFNTGLRYALDKGYKYSMTVDHDVIFMEDTIEILYDFLEKTSDVAIAGSKFCHMDRPNIIQWIGGDIDFEKFRCNNDYGDLTDGEAIPQLYYCDVAILGASMVRNEYLRKVGLLDECYFIYSEDIDWCLRFKKQGYKIAICTKSKVLHKFSMSASSKKNTSATYYYRRNNFRTLLKHMPNKKVLPYLEHIVKDLFKGLYACNYQKKYNTMKTLMYAYDDALNNTFGKAPDGRIFEHDTVENKLENLLKNKKIIALVDTDEHINDKLGKIRALINKINLLKVEISITLVTDNQQLVEQLPEMKTVSHSTFKLDSFDCALQLCSHIFSVDEFQQGYIYIDSFNNICETEQDRQYCKNFEMQYNLFYHAYFPLMVDKAQALIPVWNRKSVVEL